MASNSTVPDSTCPSNSTCPRGTLPVTITRSSGQGYMKSRFLVSSTPIEIPARGVQSVMEIDTVDRVANSDEFGGAYDGDIEVRRGNIRRSDWRKKMLRRYRHCTVSQTTYLECDAAHIVPFNLCVDDLVEWAEDPANGLLLSKNLHWTYDRLYWSLDPNDMIVPDGDDGTEDTETINLRIVVRPTKHSLSIHRYLGEYVTVRTDSLPFLRIHFGAFLSQYHKELSTRLTEAAIKEHIEDIDSDSLPLFYILDTKYDDCDKLYLVLRKSTPLKDAKWYTEDEGVAEWGHEFLEKVAELEEDLDRKDDPDWAPSAND